MSTEVCTHDMRAVCFLCSDQVSWWKEARIAAGYGELPPNAVRYVPVEEPSFVRVRRHGGSSRMLTLNNPRMVHG